MGAFNFRNTTVRGFDRVNVGPQFGPGPMDFTHGVINAHNAEIQPILDRGDFDCATLGDQLSQEWSLTVNVQALTGSDLIKSRILDFILRTGRYKNVQTFNATDNVWLCGIEVLQKLQGREQRYVLNQSSINYNFSVATDVNTWAISGIAYGGIDVF